MYCKIIYNNYEVFVKGRWNNGEMNIYSTHIYTFWFPFWHFVRYGYIHIYVFVYLYLILLINISAPVQYTHGPPCQQYQPCHPPPQMYGNRPQTIAAPSINPVSGTEFGSAAP